MAAAEEGPYRALFELQARSDRGPGLYFPGIYDLGVHCRYD